MLLEAGPDACLRPLIGEYKTALEIAEAYRQKEVVQLFLTHKAARHKFSA